MNKYNKILTLVALGFLCALSAKAQTAEVQRYNLLEQEQAQIDARRGALRERADWINAAWEAAKNLPMHQQVQTDNALNAEMAAVNQEFAQLNARYARNNAEINSIAADIVAQSQPAPRQQPRYLSTDPAAGLPAQPAPSSSPVI